MSIASESDQLQSRATDPPRGRPKLPPSGSYSSNSVLQSKKRNNNNSSTKVNHGRSLSHIMTLNSKSGTSALTSSSRPHLGRSKSTDGLSSKSQSSTNLQSAGQRPGGLKRNPRSLTKLTGLHPLTKSTLNQLIKSNKSNSSLKGMNVSALSGLKSSSKKGKAILRLNDDDDEYEDTGSLPEENTQIEKSQSHQEQQTQNTSDALQRPVLSDNPNGYSFQSAEDLSKNAYSGLLFLSQSTGLTKKFNDRGVENGLEHGTRPVPTDSNNGNGVGSISSHSESANGISFKAKPIDKIAEPITTAKTVETINSYQPNQTIFNNLQRRQPKQVAMSTAATEKAEAAAAAAAANTVATNDFQTFLKNSNTANSSGGHENRTQQRLWLQRENSLMDVPTIDPTQLANFSSLSLNNLMFSHQGMTPLEQPQQSQYQQAQTQLQQLPLLLVQLAQTPGNVVTPGVVGAGGAVSDSSASLYGLLLNIQSSHQNSIQSRTEFERLNREYLNVRRHLNPVGESLNRTQEYFNSASINQKVTKARSKQAAQSLGDSITNPSTSANTFKEFSPTYQEKESEINQLVSKMWQGALISSSSSASSSSNASPLRVSTQNQLSGLLQQLQGYPGQLGAVQHVGGGGGGGGIGGQTSQLVAGRPSSQRLQSYSQSNYLRSPQTPTTRAVKLAASGSTSQQQFKKNDHLVNLA